jgi:hypothetical protein
MVRYGQPLEVVFQQLRVAVMYTRWINAEEIRSTQQAAQAVAQGQALSRASNSSPPMEVVHRLECQLDVEFSTEGKPLARASRADAEAELMSVFGGPGRGILRVALAVDERGRVMWFGRQVAIYVGDVDKSEPRFRNYITSCLTTGVRRENSNKFNKLVAKGEITTTVIPFPSAGSRAQDISAAEFKELLTVSLYDAPSDIGIMIPRHEASGRVLAWVNDDTTGELVSRFTSLGPQLPEADGLFDLRTIEEVRDGRATEEVVFTSIMELEDEGVLNVYEQMLADTPIFAVYHALRDPRHPQAQIAMRS